MQINNINTFCKIKKAHTYYKMLSVHKIQKDTVPDII